jgi:hypothetical protein
MLSAVRATVRSTDTQMERILEVNGLHEITKAVVETARDTLLIGET